MQFTGSPLITRLYLLNKNKPLFVEWKSFNASVSAFTLADNSIYIRPNNIYCFLSMMPPKSPHNVGTHWRPDKSVRSEREQRIDGNDFISISVVRNGVRCSDLVSIFFTQAPARHIEDNYQMRSQCNSHLLE